MKHEMKHALISSCTALMVLSPVPVLSQPGGDAYPSKPVVVIAPIGAGGGIDQEARLYTTKISAMLKQQFVLDFKPGGGGSVGGALVVRAAPNGYTLLVTSGGFTVYPALVKDLPFDIIRDFAPLSMMSRRVSVLQAHPSFPATNLAEYLAYARANPGKINYGTTGNGSITHLAGAWLHEATNTKVTFVAYKGSSQLNVDLLSGRIDVASATMVTALPLAKAGKIRLLAVMNAERSKLLPSLPTMAEQGVAGYNYSSWMGFLAPAATPAPIVQALSDAFMQVARLPDVVATVESSGAVPVGSTSGEFRQQLVVELDRWKKVVQVTGVKLEE